MLLHTIILTLGLQIIFSEQPAIDCGYPGTGVVGCQYNNTIVLGYGYKDMDFVLRHEVCHALKLQDNLATKEYVATLPNTRSYTRTYINEDMIMNEKLADYCAWYLGGTLWDKKLNEIFDKQINNKYN